MEQQVFGGEHHSGRVARPLWAAMKRGMLGRCPHCGKGKLFRGFAKTLDVCEVCGEELHHHRADDLPAYLVIVIVGHIVVGGFMGVEATSTLTMWQHVLIWVPMTILLAVALLQPVKGAVIGLQWALYMHGFGGEKDEFEPHSRA
ncbi:MULTISPECIES: DUF983 domain-containing protein [unclassified Mesorhizobium]|uniref:DUF983 domain-containing protein n=1 Tax=unclassified Mesorhizobium TaxID=325217 RepID=UPI000BAF2E15|nr:MULTISPECIES: DUF983 domain-containing protein [unclassified Mesorhizobium]TGT59602.1 DUF983 domain-containing protein [Mesorhizobium sp. M00.F.Ca.ET.170.01.1.1]AZO13210.1 DUF983 domain-containing protein [Mesorhizobium sp. M3A.F.Ca.ET.080.04.2.1]PBB87256.1 hypothetical protein CK216_09955 [Mesorhizobium sp. WSM3876]RWB71450.1 MAG: DUF983 domain-containing protein [Mesorhizobium sp.]RWB91079.1 MAG: DUF983 domain-containing protein [Mesorhizobium sp.]